MEPFTCASRIRMRHRGLTMRTKNTPDHKASTANFGILSQINTVLEGAGKED